MSAFWGKKLKLYWTNVMFYNVSLAAMQKSIALLCSIRFKRGKYSDVPPLGRQCVQRKITQNLYLLSANKNFLPFETRKLLYNALLRPYLDYGAEIWGRKHLKLINTLQKKCIRHVIKTPNYISHTNDYFRLLNTPKFQDIIKMHTCRLAFKLIHMEEPPGLMQTMNLVMQKSQRRPYDITPPPNTMKKFDHLITHTLATIWNSIPTKIREPCAPHTFKERTRKYLIQEYDNVPPCKNKNCPSCSFSRPFSQK